MTGPLRYEHLQDPMGRDGTGTCIHTFAREINQIVCQLPYMDGMGQEIISQRLTILICIWIDRLHSSYVVLFVGMLPSRKSVITKLTFVSSFGQSLSIVTCAICVFGLLVELFLPMNQKSDP